MNFGPSVDTDTPDLLVHDLLHAMGQPLTSLQMCVLLRDAPPADSGSVGRYLPEMADQVTVLSRLFRTLRRVLEPGAKPLRTTSSELESLLRHLLPRWKDAAARRDLLLLTTRLHLRGDDAHRVAGSPLATCLEDLFEVALESTPKRAAITLDLVVQPDASCLFRIYGEERSAEGSAYGQYTLRAAKMLLHSGGQEFRFTSEPFAVNLTLPPCDSKGGKAERQIWSGSSEPHGGWSQ